MDMNTESITIVEAIETVEILNKIKEWAENNTSYLSRRTDCARGYAEGIQQAQDMVLSLINEGTGEEVALERIKHQRRNSHGRANNIRDII